VSGFYANRTRSDGLCSQCKVCQNAYRQRYRKTKTGKANRKKEYRRDYDTGKVLERRLRLRYNLTVKQYSRMFSEQGGNCAICSIPLNYLSADVDHNHETDKVRGLLCTRCNILLAGIDDKRFYRQAVLYLFKDIDV